MNRVELKMDAKAKLKDKWAEAIKIILLLFLISFGIGFVFGIGGYFITSIIGVDDESSELIIDIITDIVSIVVSGLFTFGFTNFFLKISRGEEATSNELFSKINMFWKFILLSIFTGLAVMIGFIFFIVPGIILALAFSQTAFILLDNPEMNVTDAMKLSYNMMMGHKMDYLVLQLSFIGWAILMAFTLGIGYFWLMPYMTVTECNFYNKIKEEYEQKNLS